jgi:superfamily II DNA or RNA helicase
LQITGRYRSDRENVVEEFYVPVLSVATSYNRAVGYFTSTSLALFARGIEEFAERGGTMCLIASPYLDYEDIVDIEHGYSVRAVIERAVLRELDEDADEGILNGLGLLGRLVAQDKLDIKLAFLLKAGRIGLYHEKIGVFRDEAGDLVAFTGSANETFGGLLANFESVEVYLGWMPGDGPRALRLEADFEELWSNRTPNLTVEPFPSVARERLIEIARRHPLAAVRATDDAFDVREASPDAPKHLAIPSSLTVRGYQRRAVEEWLRHQGRGILAMATGTGKTKTAMFAATQLAHVLRQREDPFVVVVLAPLNHLVDQWLTEVESFGIRSVAVYESSERWIPIVESQLAEARLGQRPVVVLVATYASFMGERFQAVLSRITQPLLLIADEAHNLGSENYRSFLPSNATYRLALSATPERWFDADGTEALIDYFGPIVFELGLGKAIEMGVLCRYRYLPRLVELADDENQLYADLTTRIAHCLSAGESLDADDVDSPLGHLLRQRAGVLGHAEGKLPRLQSDLSARSDAWYQLVYCAEGNRPTWPGEPSGPNQLAEVMDLAGNTLHLAVHSYVAETARPDRQVLLRRFNTGNDLRVLVAMRCLDEGVDIPNARIGYLLASSSNPRQFIQRRGRLLRRADGKEHAEILDYITVPGASAPINFDVERKLLARELQRASEFGKLAENYEATLQALRPLKDKYQLMDL